MPSLHSLVVRRANPLMEMGTATSSVTSVNQTIKNQPNTMKSNNSIHNNNNNINNINNNIKIDKKINKLNVIKLPLIKKEKSAINLSLNNDNNNIINNDINKPLIRHESSASLEAARSSNWINIGKTNLRKCETTVGLSTLTIDRPINRSRVCSRCSSLLSLASSSRYSLAAGNFVPTTSTTTSSSSSSSSSSSTTTTITTPKKNAKQYLCKICLVDVSFNQTFRIEGCGCYYCKDCMRNYVEFEIEEGAYEISCPDSQCDWSSVLTLKEISSLVTPELMEKHHKFRLNRDVSMDKDRAWCPRAGCETICTVKNGNTSDGNSDGGDDGGNVTPGPVHCPNCSTDFCSICREPWHNGQCPNLPLGIPFDNDHIKCCPMCSVPIEKDEGCAQMMCKRCKHVFCWYCLASLDDDFLLRHYDKGPCKNKLGHSRASVIWHRTQVIGIFAGFGLLLLVASPLLLLAAPCIVCCKCRVCGTSRLDQDGGNHEDTST